MIVKVDCLPELLSGGFADGSFRITRGGFDDEALEAGVSLGAGFNAEALDGGKIGRLIGVTLVLSSTSNDTVLLDLVGGS